MRRRGQVEPRRVVFLGVEGKSERAFAQFLVRCCEESGLRLHLDVKSAGGGDSFSVVQEAGRRLERHPGRREFKDRIVLLDRDRLDQDTRAGRDARALASKLKIDVVLQEPNLEGLLLRLHPGNERRRIAPKNTMKELRKVWPDYRKPPSARELRQRFDLFSLRRAAHFDSELTRLMRILGL